MDMLNVFQDKINDFVQFSLVMNALEIKIANGFNHQEQNDDIDDSDFLF